jgi:hypothetical protein
MSDPLQQALHTLTTRDTILRGGDFAIMHRHKRWHLLTLGYTGARFGLHTINFMSDERARQTIADWLSSSEIVSFDEVSHSFAGEVQTKVLPRAKDYLPLLERHALDIGGGYTTDTLWFAGYDAEKQKAFINSISRMMKSGQAGPFLRFHE